MKTTRLYLGSIFAMGFVPLFCSGCLLAAAGVGAEAGYVLMQDDRTPSETVRDQALVTQVKTKLLADKEVSGLNINVDSFKGMITLKGVVDSQLEVDKAIMLARSVNGVSEVTSKLFVSN